MVEALITQSCLTFATPWTVACQAPSVHGTSQTSILRLPFSSPGDLPPRDWTQVSRIAGRLFTVRATREASYFCMRAQSLQLWTALCNSIERSPPGFSVHGILQARILEWVAMPSTGGFSWPGEWAHICLHLLHYRWTLYPLSHLGIPYFGIPNGFSNILSQFCEGNISLVVIELFPMIKNHDKIASIYWMPTLGHGLLANKLKWWDK